jgi:hypothetical protein
MVYSNTYGADSAINTIITADSANDVDIIVKPLVW